MRKLTIFLAMAAVLALTVPTYAAVHSGEKRYWDDEGADNLWQTAANWDNDTMPQGFRDHPTIPGDVIKGDDCRFYDEYVGRINDATFTTPSYDYISCGQNGKVGHVILEAGKIYMAHGNAKLSIAYRSQPSDIDDPATYSSFTQLGGEVDVSAILVGKCYSGGNNEACGLLAFKGGKIKTERDLEVGIGVNNSGFNARGVFQVFGNAPGSSIEIGDDLMMGGPGATLMYEVDGDNAAGITKIELDDSALFDGTIMVTVKDGTILTQDHYVLMTYSSRGTSTFDSKDLPSGWDIAYDQGLGGNELWLVPEPASATLLLLGVITMLKRRRR